jgi:serine/threonine protein kinase
VSESNETDPTRVDPLQRTADQITKKRPSGTSLSPTDASRDNTPVSQARPAPGRAFPTIPGYEILDELGRGGMGVVYKARQLGLNRLVALKVVLAGSCAGAEHLARFHTEAEAIARLQHPNIVQIHEIGEHDGLPYFSLELIEGGNLAELIAKRPQTPEVAARLVETLARAVHFAHTRGIIHRDLKPSNILITDCGERYRESSTAIQVGANTSPGREHSGEVVESALSAPNSAIKVADFGLAKAVADPSQTDTGAILGTPSYMAPEQASGFAAFAGPPADQYALGAILYELLTGRPPFKGTTVIDTLEQVRTREPVPPSQLQAKIPADLETICLKCLQKDPRQRYASVLELANDLDRFQDGRPIVARPIGNVERAIRWARRNPRVAGLLGAVAVLLLALVGVSWVFTLMLARAKAKSDDNARLATEQAALAREHAHVAEKQTELAIDALGVLISKAQTLLEEVPNSARTREELLKLALEKFQEVERAHKPGLTDRGMAAAHKKMGDLYLMLNKKDEALRHFEKGRDITEALYRAEPGNDKAMGNYAVFLVTFGDWSRNQDKNFVKAREYYENALQLQLDALHVTGPGADLTQAEKKISVGGTHDQLGTLAYNQGNTDEAEPHFKDALALYESAYKESPNDAARQKLAQSHLFLGAVEVRRKNLDAEMAHHVQEQIIRRQIYDANPTNGKARNDLAGLDYRIGLAQYQKKDFGAAQQSFDEYLKLRREIYATNPSNGALQRQLSQALYASATTAQARDDTSKAKASFDECLKLRRDYVKALPNDVNGWIDLMIVCARSGDDKEAARLAEQEVRKRAGDDGRLLFQIACGYALCINDVSEESQKAAYAAKAVEALSQAWEHGFKNMSVIDTEPDLDALRPREEFRAFRSMLPK